MVIILLLLPQGVFAEISNGTVQTETLTQNSSAVSRAQILIKRKMRLYHHYNIQVLGDDAWFFAFHKTNHNIPFGWYRLDLTKKFSRAERIVSSSDFSMIFRTALSPDGREMIMTSKTGEIFVQNLINGKKQSLGAYVTNQDYSRYSFPTYTPDGRFLILHDPWDNSLLIVDAASMDISNGIIIPGFWLTEMGSERPESGVNLSIYHFSDDGTSVTFGDRGQTLNLLTITNE